MKIWRPFTQMKDAALAPQIVSASGAYLKTKEHGECLDGISSWWLITHGHCHPRIVEAIQKQAAKIDQINFASFTHEPAEQLAEALSELLPSQLNNLFYSDNGSTAVEVALKMSLQYFKQTNRPHKNQFLAFENAYHGDTCGAMSVTGDSLFTKPYQGFRFEVLRLRQGHLSTDPLDLWTSHFKEVLKSQHEKIAAIIIEPLVQGAGGMIVWPVEAIQEICSLCRQYNILIIFDEVMTGFGRTGSMFAFEQIDVVPDFLCLSKGLTGGSLPLAMTITTKQIYEAYLSDEPAKMFFHGHSFTANPIACAAACANLKIFEEEETLDKIEEIEKTHRRVLESIRNMPKVNEVRVKGGIGIVELNSDEMSYGSKLSKEISRKCLEDGIFIRPLGNVIYLMPPYSTKLEAIERAWLSISNLFRLLS